MSETGKYTTPQQKTSGKGGGHQEPAHALYEQTVAAHSPLLACEVMPPSSARSGKILKKQFKEAFQFYYKKLF